MEETTKNRMSETVEAANTCTCRRHAVHARYPLVSKCCGRRVRLSTPPARLTCEHRRKNRTNANGQPTTSLDPSN